MSLGSMSHQAVCEAIGVGGHAGEALYPADRFTAQGSAPGLCPSGGFSLES